MREIKFRYWDKWNEEMIYSDYDLTKFFERVQELFLGENGVEIMQYTGLKDKHGRDIYEGDIVTCEIYERENYDESNSGVPLEVTYNETYAGFSPFSKGAQWRSGVNNIEIIGNIYENPELMK